MANSVDTLEAVLFSSECKLDSILYHLEQRLSTVDSNYTDNDSDEQIVMNCSKIMITIKEIRNDLEIVKTEHKQLIDLRNDLNNKLIDKCSQLQQNIQQLQQNII